MQISEDMLKGVAAVGSILAAIGAVIGIVKTHLVSKIGAAAVQSGPFAGFIVGLGAVGFSAADMPHHANSKDGAILGFGIGLVICSSVLVIRRLIDAA